MLNRRDSLKVIAAAGVVLALPTRQVVEALAGEAAVPAAAFTVPLPIPPVLSPVSRDLRTDYYHMTIRNGAARILQGVDTPVLTYDGEFPGPTIRAVRGRPAVVRVTNGLSTPTAVHLHGGDVPQSSDGYPLDVMQPGASREYVYPNHQPAATLWYHDHAHHLEAEQIYRGLAGTYIVDDPSAGLPSGACDIPLLLRDAGFTQNGELRWQSGDQNRTTVLVNGAIQPVHTVERRKYRLRLVNIANERNFRLRFGGAEFLLVGLDGGLLRQPIRTREVFISSAERAEVVVDFSKFAAGSSVVMQNVEGTADANTNLLKFDVAGGAAVREPALDLAALAAAAAPPLSTSATVTRIRKVVFAFDTATGTFLINGKTFDPDRVDFTVKRGTTEIWEISTDGPIPINHSMHLHLIQFRVLDRNGVPVSAAEAYPKDNVYVPFGETVRILVTYYSRYTGLFPFHCHFVDHSSIGMMAQMRIVP